MIPNRFAGQLENKRHVFRLNDENGYYQKVSAPMGFAKIPGELKLEKTFRTDIKQKAEFFLRSRTVNKKREFQTGLIFTGLPDWYFGDHYHPQERAKNSFCLFHFSESQTELTIYYFNHVKIYPNERESFIRDFVRREQIKMGGDKPTSHVQINSQGEP